MRVIFLVVSSIAASVAATAWGQNGLYGSPDLLRLPNNSLAVASDGAPGIAPDRAVSTQSYYSNAAAPSSAPSVTTSQPLPGPPPVQNPPCANGQWLPGPQPVQNPPCATGQWLPGPQPVQNPPCANGQWLPGPQPAGPSGSFFCDCGGGDMPWYGSLWALYMTRGDANHMFLSYDQATRFQNRYLDADLPMSWQPGGEIRVGRSFDCGTWAVEGVYWSLASFSGTQSVSDYSGPNSADLCSTLNGQAITLPGSPAAGATQYPLSFDPNASSPNSFFDEAVFQQLTRHDDVQNLEINVRRNFSGGCGSPWQFSVLGGIRYFYFSDELDFCSAPSWDRDPSATAYLTDRVLNNLCGPQIGFDIGYCVQPRLRVFLNSSLGIYDNHMVMDFDIYNNYGGQVNHASPNDPAHSPAYPLHATKDDIAFLSQFDLGLDWGISCNWSAQIGYRVVVASGIATADQQLPLDLAATADMMNIKNQGDLILHGAFAGISCRF